MMKAIRVSAMVLALVGSAHAGEVLTPPAPQPPPSQAVQEPTTFGALQPDDVPSTDGDIQNDAAITFVQVVLNLLALS